VARAPAFDLRSSAAAAVVDQAYEQFVSDTDGVVSTVYPALATADPDLFGLAVVGVSGVLHEVGDAHVPFTLMSAAKPFAFAAVAQELGIESVRQVVGVNPTGAPFNSLQAVHRLPDGPGNPMVNAGAILTLSLLPGDSPDDKWSFLLDRLSAFAGRPLHLDPVMYDSAASTNFRNRELTALLVEHGLLTSDPQIALDLYTRQSCVAVEAVDLATMGATIANGGCNPVTGEFVVEPVVARAAMVVMTVAGMYEISGDWLWDVGLPGKSGISGAMVTVSPGRGALATYSPPLDPAGNSVRGKRAAAFLAHALDLDMVAAHPSST
jgi:glutaminase